MAAEPKQEAIEIGGGRDRPRLFLPLGVIAAFALLAGAAAAIEEKVAPCFSCHGERGVSQVPETPTLAGQPAYFLLIEIFQFRERLRQIPIMNEAVKGLSNDEMKAMADYLAGLAPPRPLADGGDRTRLERGRALVAAHHCGFCHNPDFSGREQMPRLAGQREDYLRKALRDYKSGARPGYDPMMAMVLYPVSETDIDDLAHLLAHLPASDRP
ncbi:MAG TPA: c-type cytochrome [Xanthobacteraceae bacterium]|nr:c-type cytochrome [Xanthobacteraceae bacterium]